MNRDFHNSRPLYFSIPIALLVIVAGVAGIFFKNTYSQETVSWAVQGVGQDLANLIVAVPALLVSAALIRRGSKAALLVWLGTAIYFLYSFVIYCFALHFNFLFLVYCAVLGLSFYSIVSLLSSLDKSAIKSWFDEKRSNNFAIYYLLTVSILFFLMWMKQIISALITGEAPQDLKENGLLTNPVHVLDLAFFLPGSFISAILLKRKTPLGYLFAPAMITFSTIMALTIGGLALVMKMNNVSSDATVSVVFAGVALISCFILVNFMGSFRSESVQGK